jgi:hypothetical protein
MVLLASHSFNPEQMVNRSTVHPVVAEKLQLLVAIVVLLKSEAV